MRYKFLLLPLLALPLLAQAGEPAPQPGTSTHATAHRPTDAPPPPTIGDETTGPEPEITIVQKGSDKIEEYRLNGRLYMVKVTPRIGAPYYLVDEDGSGQLRQVDPNRRIIIPRWVLLRF